MTARALWTPRDEKLLRVNWGSLSLAELAALLERTPVAIYCRAREMGLECGATAGREYLSHAAKRTGFARPALRRIFRWAGVRIMATPSRPGVRGWSRSTVEPYDVDTAIEAWLATETLSGAARRVGTDNVTLKRWLLEGGAGDALVVITPIGGRSKLRSRHVRIATEVVDRVIAERLRRESLAQAARRVGIRQRTLGRWLAEAGVRPEGKKSTLVDPAEVDRVLEAHGRWKVAA